MWMHYTMAVYIIYEVVKIYLHFNQNKTFIKELLFIRIKYTRIRHWLGLIEYIQMLKFLFSVIIQSTFWVLFKISLIPCIKAFLEYITVIFHGV